MHPGQNQPNDLECAILERIAQDEPWLQGPFASLRVLNREYTGVGSYTNFVCDAPDAENDPFPGLKPLMRVPGVPNGMGAVLYCRGTLPKCLELFTYGDDPWDATYEGFMFEETTKA
ncbi:MAG: hypothetical protein QOG51_1651 [Verrucomicrobiota bacterium]